MLIFFFLFFSSIILVFLNVKLLYLALLLLLFSREVMSDSLRPHGLQPTRFFCPWDFPRQEYHSRSPCHSSGDLSDPEIKYVSLALASRFFTTKLAGKPIWLFSSVQSLSRVQLFGTPRIAARQASLSITNSRSSPKRMSINLVMPSSHLILHCPLLLLPPIPPSIRIFSNESTLHMRWPKYWSFSFTFQ